MFEYFKCKEGSIMFFYIGLYVHCAISPPFTKPHLALISIPKIETSFRFCFLGGEMGEVRRTHRRAPACPRAAGGAPRVARPADAAGVGLLAPAHRRFRAGGVFILPHRRCSFMRIKTREREISRDPTGRWSERSEISERSSVAPGFRVTPALPPSHTCKL